ASNWNNDNYLDDYIYWCGRYCIPYFAWSADDTRLVLAKDPFPSGFDSDIWVLELASATLSNLTDDGHSGIQIEADIPVDYLPIWLDNNNLLFFRSFTAGNGFLKSLFTFQLSLISHEISLLSDLSEKFFWLAQAAAI